MASLARARSSSVGLQKLSRAHDENVTKRLELPKVLVSRDNDVHLGFKGTFEDAVVRLVLSDEVDGFLGSNELSELLDGGYGLPRALR